MAKYRNKSSVDMAVTRHPCGSKSDAMTRRCWSNASLN